MLCFKAYFRGMVIQVLRRQATRLACDQYPAIIIPRRLHSTTASKPLRLLFCGSDDFSCASLRAVHQEHLRNPQSIASIDVLLRPGKPSGRGLKSIREVPIKDVAQQLGLRIHERDTFTGWTLPKHDGEPLNLIIAVSFGLFVPPRILKSAEFGGINIHPSLLPDFRGPAPLQHTLLACEAHTGVTLQTLHPEKFDHGVILAQTPLPGFEIPNPLQCTYPELLRLVTPKAAEMLVQGIRDRVFLPGAISSPISISSKPYGHPIRHAPKITPKDRHIDWAKMTVDEILRRDRVLGRLWGLVHIKGQGPTRAVFGGLAAVPLDESFWENEVSVTHKLPLVSIDGELVTRPCLVDGEAVIVSNPIGGAIRIEEVTVAGDKKTGAAKALSRAIN